MVVTIHPIVVLHKINAVLMATLKPLGIWGLGGLAFIDSGLFPLPTTMDGVVIGYVAVDHRKFLIYVLMAAGASAIGSLIPYYVGRAGGELFLLKRINRARYEGLRDRFERQEFMAIMVPAMMPPPMPIKLFEFAAGGVRKKPAPLATGGLLRQIHPVYGVRADHDLLRPGDRACWPAGDPRASWDRAGVCGCDCAGAVCLCPAQAVRRTGGRAVSAGRDGRAG